METFLVGLFIHTFGNAFGGAFYPYFWKRFWWGFLSILLDILTLSFGNSLMDFCLIYNPLLELFCWWIFALY